MKIKLALLEKDPVYLMRITQTFHLKYADKLEVYSFTDLKLAMAALPEAHIDVFLASDSFEIETNLLPKSCGFAYLVASREIETMRGERTICKFQKADLIYRYALDIYAEVSENLTGIRLYGSGCRILLFTSPVGGAGTTSLAAGYAKYHAFRGEKVLYLNLEYFGASSVLFSAEGAFCMTDLIYCLKSKKQTLPYKMESCVRQDHSGVFFFQESKNSLDLMELSAEEVVDLVNGLSASGRYDKVVVDMGFSLDEAHMEVFRSAHEMFWVSDGLEVSNTKIRRAYEAFTVLEEQRGERPHRGQIRIFYNKFFQPASQQITGLSLPVAGTLPYYGHMAIRQVLDALAEEEIFGKLD